jgi:phenylacetate-CoA ligase
LNTSDALETRNPAEREAALFAALARQIAHAQSRAAYFAEILDIDARDITSRAALATLPVTRKSEMTMQQRIAPPLAA